MVTPAIAIIPARGGSKSIPRKNIKDLAGFPLIAYSIVAGLQARLVQRVIVSTDNEEIAQVARAWGAEVPFVRPANISEDATPDLPVFEHALHWLAEHEDYHPEIVVQLRPTSPLRPIDCVDRSVQMLIDHPEADCVRGVVESGENPYKMWKLRDDGRLQPLLNEGFIEPYNMPRQRLPTTYWQTGHIDAIRARTILKKHSLSGDHLHALIIDPAYKVDIDTLEEWDYIEWKLKRFTLPFVQPKQSS